jgi:hypothetical protein
VSDFERSFAFVQFEFPGRLGLDDGRYVVRSGEDVEHVLVVAGGEAIPPPSRAHRRARRWRVQSAEPGTPPVPVTTLTVIRSSAFESRDEAEGWLVSTGRDRERAEGELDEAVAVVNRAVHAQRAASHDPYAPDLTPARALVVRLGHGTGDEVADGEWTEAVELPPDERRQRRIDALRPQERVAAVLGGRDRIDACETLLLRARADLDAGRGREGALQLRAGLEALLMELPEPAGPDHAEDVTSLRRRQAATEEAAGEALQGGLSPARIAELSETLGICERVLRRRRILGD